MARDTGIATRLRQAGLKVVEVAGWQTRGSETFDPDGSVDHHTAGARSGNVPSLAVCIYGRPDVPGPLCQVLIGRDNTCYVIAAGRANHAGTGGWSGISGNRNVYGIERENVGTTAEPWTVEQTEIAARAHAALIDGRNPLLVCEHKEWAPNRKIDAHSISGGTMRALVQRYQNDPDPTPDVPEDDDMAYYAVINGPGKPTRLFVDGALLGFPNPTELNETVAVYAAAGYQRKNVTFKEVDDWQRYMDNLPATLADVQTAVDNVIGLHNATEGSGLRQIVSSEVTEALAPPELA